MNRLLVALLVLTVSAAGAFAQTTQATSQASKPAGPVAVVALEGEINDYSAGMFEKHVAAAREAGAKTILMRLNTPGGMVVSALRLSSFIKRQRQDVTMVAVVDEMAFSAGSMIAVACDRIVMQPGAWIGDCAPIMVTEQGLQTMGAAERAKMESPILADFLDSANRAGYDPLMLSAMVQYGVVVHYLQSPEGERKFVNEADSAALKQSGWTVVPGTPDPLDGAGSLLTVNDALATKIGLSAGTFASPEAYAASLKQPIVGTFDTNFSERVVGFLSNAVVRGFLTTIFLAALYTAFSKPGTGLPEAVALVLGALLLGVPLLTGYAGVLELLLIFTGLSLIAMEIFVIPGFGVAGVVGLVMMLVGLVLSFAPPELPGGGIIPQLQATRDALRQGLYVTTGCLVVSGLLWYWLARYLPSIPYMNRLVLQMPVGTLTEPGDTRQAIEDTWPTVGESGVAVTKLTPGGVARFYDPIINDQRNVDVVCDSGYVEQGRPLVVKHKEGPRVVVRPLVPSPGTPGEG